MGQNAVDFFRETEILLEQWGRWCRADGNKIGYPGMVPFAKEMPRDLESSIALMSDDEASEIEGVMLLLRGCNPIAYKVALYRYVGRHTLQIAAKKLHIGHTKAKTELRAAVYFAMGSLYKNTAK